MRALITGISGQDGSYLAELLLSKGYEVHGVVRRVALEDPEHRLWRIIPLMDKLTLHVGSVESLPSIYRVFQRVAPDECYHLAAQTYVALSFEDEASTINANLIGTHHVLAAIADCAPQCRLYFAGSSEVFGKVSEAPQNERTPMNPRSAYGISKLAGLHLTRNYRESYGLRACCGILYNHESPRRGFEFVTRKITSHAARIKLGLAKELRLGDLDAVRDWGHARDYVNAMWLLLQHEQPGDCVVATGEVHSVRDFAREAFSYVGLAYEDHVVIDSALVRPRESVHLVGDAAQAREKFGWKPTINFRDLVREMVEADLAAARSGLSR